MVSEVKPRAPVYITLSLPLAHNSTTRFYCVSEDKKQKEQLTSK